MFYSTKQVLYDNIASNMTKIICYSQGIFLNNKKKKRKVSFLNIIL